MIETVIQIGRLERESDGATLVDNVGHKIIIEWGYHYFNYEKKDKLYQEKNDKLVII